MKVNNNTRLAVAGIVVATAAAVGAVTESLELRTGGRTTGIPANIVSKSLQGQHRINDNSSYEANLVGFIYYNSAWEDLEDTTPFGMYTISTRPGSQPQEFAQIGQLSSYTSGGAVLAGDIMWYIWRQQASSGDQSVDISQLYSYNINTREFKRHGEVSNELASKNDHAWDPSTGIIYGTYDIDGTRTLCTVDYANKKRTAIAPCDAYYGLACDGKGVLYGVNAVGDLNIIDTRTATSTRVGNTGVMPKYAQSMVYDQQANVIWWAALTEKESGIYRIDPSTASVTKVTEFDGLTEIMGLGVIPSGYADGVPGYASDLSVQTDGESTSAKYSFTLPAFDFIGLPLAGEVSYKVTANNRAVAEGKGEPGEKVSGTAILPEGSVQLKVVCSNSEGEGPAVMLQHWIGPGYPEPTTDVRFSISDGGNVSLAWEPVTNGFDGGYIDPAKVTYKVIAYPDARVAATGLKECSFTETIEVPERPVQMHYEVIACNDWRESEPTQSNNIIFGKGFGLPYSNDFNNKDALALFTIIDGNGDGKTWERSVYADSPMAYIFTGTMNHDFQDDWLITPGLEMKAGARYRLSFYTDMTLGGSRFTDMLEIGFGRGVDPEGYEIVKEPFRTDPMSRNRIELTVEVKEDGYYHFGFHCISDTDISLQVNIDDLLVEQVANYNAPAAVTDLEVKTTNGGVPVRFSFRTPTKTSGGDDLDKVTKVELWRDEEVLVSTKTMTETGKKTILVDENCSNGMHTYYVVAYNDNGVGERSEVKVYVGLDTPKNPANVSLSDNYDGTLTLSWEAPTEGVNGGYVDPQTLEYNVYTVEDGYAVDFKAGLTETETTVQVDEASYYGDVQGLTMLAVAARNSVGESAVIVSNEVIVGAPYELPYQESWANGSASSFWTYANSGKSGWEISGGSVACDKDNGFMAFAAANDGDMSYLYLGKVNINNKEKPLLKYNYYAVPGSDSFIQVEVNKAYKDGWHVEPCIDFRTLEGKSEWREAIVDLSQFTSYPYITLRFLGKTTTTTPLFIDNISVADASASVECPESDSDDAKIVYDMFGLEVKHPQKGCIYVVRKSDGTSHKIVY